MKPFRWLEEPGQVESLAICVRSLTAQAGPPKDYDELVAGLGLGWLVAADGRFGMDAWATLARDELLVATAAQSGVRLRELHPRQAAVGLERSAEYRLHFLDSYVPLIERALLCGQAAIAWRGWPPPGETQWGVLTAYREGVVSGYTLGHSGEPLGLNSPAQQVYIVEEVVAASAPLSPAECFARVAWAAVSQEGGTWCSDIGLVTGSKAWGRWKDRLLVEGGGGAEKRSYAAAALPVAAAREALGRWLVRTAGGLSGAERAAAVAWAERCDVAGRRLRDSVPKSGAATLEPTKWRSRAVETLDDLAASDVEIVEIVAPHARPIAVRPAYEPDALSA